MKLLACILGVLACGWGLQAEEVVIDWREVELRAVTPITSRSGEAIFPRELYTLVRPEDFRVAADLGFNAVIAEGLAAYHAAEAAGFWVTETNWFHLGFRDEQATAVGESFRGLPRLLAHNLNDEPDLRIHISGPEVLARAAELIARTDQEARFSVTLAGWGRARSYWPDFVKPLYIIRIDPYPLITRHPLSHVTELIEAAQAVGEARPVLCILQAWSWPGGPFPDAAQTRNMVWQALIAGAAGISFFDWNDAEWAAQPSFWQELPSVNRDIVEHLEPLLTHGRRSEPVKQGGIAAALWVGADERWAMLLTPLNPLAKPVQVTVQLPLALAGKTVRVHYRPESESVGVEVVDGAISLTLSGLQAAMVLPEETEAPDAPTVVGELWQVDWAGRPWRRADADELPEHYRRVLPADSPQVAAGIELRVTGGVPVDGALNHAGLVFRAAPGASMPMVVELEADPESRATLEAIAWHDTRETIQGPALAKIVTFQRRADDEAAPRLRRHDLLVHLPATSDWLMYRDHLLTLRLTYEGLGQAVQEDRVIRFRLSPPVTFGWSWVARNRGRLTVEPTLAEAFYTPRPSEWQVSWQADPMTIQPVDGEEGAYEVTVPDEHTSAMPVTLTAKVRAGDVELASGGVAQVVIERGELIRPDDPRSALASPLEPWPPESPFAARWEAKAELAPLRHFLNRGSHSYADPPTTAWFGWNRDGLVWFMELEISERELRAETQEDDTPFLGDTLMALLMEGGDERLYYLQLNPGGVASHAVVAPVFDAGWNPTLATESRHHDGRWQLIAELPWTALGWQDAPEAGSTLRFNVATAHSIAPRIWHSWHFWGAPFEAAASMADLLLDE